MGPLAPDESSAQFSLPTPPATLPPLEGLLRATPPPSEPVLGRVAPARQQLSNLCLTRRCCRPAPGNFRHHDTGGVRINDVANFRPRSVPGATRPNQRRRPGPAAGPDAGLQRL